MKKIRVPIIDVDIELYEGDDEWNKYKKVILKYTQNSEFIKEVLKSEVPESSAEGRAYGSMIWVKTRKNVNTVFHEIAHSLSAVYETRRFSDEEEFKAYIAGYVYEKAFEWIMEDYNIENGFAFTLLEDARKLLSDKSKVFKKYEKLHREKKTDDGNKKADINKRHYEEIDSFINYLKEIK